MGRKLKTLFISLFIGGGMFSRIAQDTGVDVSESFLFKTILEAIKSIGPASAIDPFISMIDWFFYGVEFLGLISLFYLIYLYAVQRKRIDFIVAMVCGIMGGYLMPAAGQPNLQTVGVFLSFICIGITNKLLPDIPELDFIAKLLGEDLEDVLRGDKEDKTGEGTLKKRSKKGRKKKS